MATLDNLEYQDDLDCTIHDEKPVFEERSKKLDSDHIVRALESHYACCPSSDFPNLVIVCH